MPTRRRILLCRIGFVLLCVLPTLAVGLWAATRTAGGYGLSKDQWQRELTDRLGLVVEIGSASYPRADVARLDDVTLRDGETDAVVGQARTIEIQRSPDGWLVAATQVQVQADQLKLLRQTLEHRVLRAPPLADDVAFHPPVTFDFSDLTIMSLHGPQSLSRLHGSLLHEAGGVSLRLDWQTAGSPAAEHSGQFTVLRNRAALPPETIWHLDTAGRAAPCMLLADALPQVARLGRDCRFAGSVQWSDSSAGARGSLRGKFSHIDLDALVTEHFPHQLSGSAQLEITRAEIDAGKLIALSGSLVSNDGAISLSLVEALQEHVQLDLLADPQWLDAGRPLPFRRLAAAFELNGRSLRIVGQAGRANDGIVLAGVDGPILAALPEHTASPIGLLRALLPDNQFQVPATRQTDALVGLFPVPDIVPARTAALPRHTPTRLRSSGPPEAAPVVRQPKLR